MRIRREFVTKAEEERAATKRAIGAAILTGVFAIAASWLLGTAGASFAVDRECKRLGYSGGGVSLFAGDRLCRTYVSLDDAKLRSIPR